MSGYDPKHDTKQQKTSLLLSNRSYDFLKKLVTLYLPAFGTLYLTLAGIWGLPHAEEVVGTTVALATFFGVVLQISSSSYNNSDAKYDGTMDVIDTEERTAFSLNLDTDPHDLVHQEAVTFKINTQP